MTNNTYLQDLAKRKFDESLKANLTFGLSLGWALTLIGAFRCFMLLEPNWFYAMILGMVLLFVSLVVPQALEKPQYYIKEVGGFVATQLFRVFLTVFYFVAIMPVGLIYQATKGSAPFYSWDGPAPANMEGWVPKKCTDEGKLVVNQAKAQNPFMQPLHVLGYFASHGELIFMPCLILFLVLGVLGVFVQSTGLAPLIYTLF